MKTIKSFIFLFALSIGITSCSDDSNGTTPVAENLLDAYSLTSSFEANGHVLELYSECHHILESHDAYGRQVPFMPKIEDFNNGGQYRLYGIYRFSNGQQCR